MRPSRRLVPFFVTTASFCLAVLVDLLVVRATSLAALYAIPPLVAARYWSPTAIAAVSALSALGYLLAAMPQPVSSTSIVFGVGALAAIGCLGLLLSQRGDSTERDASEVARVEAQLRARVRQQEAVAELGLEALTGTSLDELVDRATVLVRNTLAVDFVGVLERSKDGSSLWLRAGAGWSPGTVGQVTLPVSAELQTGYTLISRGPVLVEDFDRETRFRPSPLMRAHGVVSGISVVIHGPDRPFGVLSAHTRYRRQFHQDDVHFLQSIANVLATAIGRKQVETELQRRLNLIEHLYRLGDAVNRAASLDDVYAAALKSLQDTVGSDRAAVLLLHADGVMRFVAWNGLSDQYREATTGHSPWERDERSPRPVLVPDVTTEPQLESLRPIILSEGIHALGFIPLVHHGTLHGKFMLYYNQPHEFADDEVQIATIVAGVIAHAIVRKQSDLERERALGREEALARIGRALVSEVELGAVADVVIEQGLATLAADSVVVWKADPIRRELVLLASKHVSPATEEALRRIPYDATLVAARVARTEQLQVIEDVDSLGDTLQRATMVARAEGVRSLLTVPLCSRGRLVGVVSYGTYHRRRFTQQDLDINRAVADLFAVAIENAQLYDQLRENLRLREEFLVAAAHELKTPMTAIKGWVEVLLQTGMHVDRERRALETIHRQAERIARLVEDLLAVGRLHTAQDGTPLRRDRFDLKVLITDLVDQMRRITNQHDFEVTAPVSTFVTGDRELIAEVLHHLVENAIRYSPWGGPIEIVLQQTNGEAVVSVTDHGVGIPTDRQTHVFEPFFELIPSGAPGYTGVVSLGLYLARQVVTAHGGHIWFTSTPDVGSTFAFSLPTEVQP